MASRKRGLNPSFNLGQRVQEIMAYNPRSSLPSAATVADEDIQDTAVSNRPNAFAPVILAKSDAYFQATSASSRVAGFQFVPTNSRYLSMDQFEDALNNNDDIEGYLYVWWVKGSNISKYGPLSLDEYENFRDSPIDNSYGRAVVVLQQQTGYYYDVGFIGG